MLGREVRLPSEIIFGSKMRFQDENIVNYGLYVEVLRDELQRAHQNAREHLSRSNERQRDFYNLKSTLYHYKKGDKVWFLNEGHKDGKLGDLYWGPCTISQKLSDLTYKIQNSRNGTTKVVHHDKLKPFYVHK